MIRSMDTKNEPDSTVENGYVFLRVKKTDMDSLRRLMEAAGFGMFRNVSNAELVRMGLDALKEKLSPMPKEPAHEQN